MIQEKKKLKLSFWLLYNNKKIQDIVDFSILLTVEQMQNFDYL